MSSNDASLPDAPVAPKRSRPAFIAGVVLLVINIPFGLGGAAICSAIGVATGRKALWVSIGVGIYAISWLMLFAGMYLAGKEGVEFAKSVWHRKKKVESGTPDEKA